MREKRTFTVVENKLEKLEQASEAIEDLLNFPIHKGFGGRLQALYSELRLVIRLLRERKEVVDNAVE